MCYRMSEISRHPVVAATRALRFADHVTKRNEGSGNENGINCFRSTFHWLKKEHAQLNRKLKENYFPKSNNRIPVPVKSLPRPLSRQHVCRCCNSSFVSNPIDLFGAKSESEDLLSIIVKVTGRLKQFVSEVSH